MKQLLKKTARAAFLFAAVLLASLTAKAQDGDPNYLQEPDKPVEAKGVGIAGGAIAGAEVVVVGEAIFGVDRVWAYLTFPLLGAVGGGIGGYFVEKESTGGSVALLVGSMAFVIPTALFASAATAYDPVEDGAIDTTDVEKKKFKFEEVPSVKPKADETTTDVEQSPESGSQGRRKKENRPAVGALFQLEKDGTPRFSIPAVVVCPGSLPSIDGAQDGNKGIEIHVPLVRVDLP